MTNARAFSPVVATIVRSVLGQRKAKEEIALSHEQIRRFSAQLRVERHDRALFQELVVVCVRMHAMGLVKLAAQLAALARIGVTMEEAPLLQQRVRQNGLRLPAAGVGLRRPLGTSA